MRGRPTVTTVGRPLKAEQGRGEASPTGRFCGVGETHVPVGECQSRQSV